MSKVQVSPLRNPITTSTLPYAHYTNVNFRDVVTSELVWTWGNDAQSTNYLWTQAGEFVGPTQVATSSAAQMGPIAVAQDSNGDLHILCEYGGGASYCRASLTRSGGHITGWSFPTTPFYLPAMTSSLGGFPWGATILCLTNGLGVERVIIASLDGNDSNQFCAAVLQGPLNATEESDFTSLAGVASTWTKFPTQTCSANVNAPYCFNIAIEQYGTSGHFFVVAGPSSRGDLGNYASAVVGYRALASGATWTVDTANPCTLAAESYESFCLHSCVDADGNAYFGWTTRTTDTSTGTLGLSKIATDGTFTENWLSTTFTNQGEISGFPAVCDDGTVIFGIVPGDVGPSATRQEIKVYSGGNWYTYQAGSTSWVAATDLSWANVGSRGWRDGIVISWGSTNSSRLSLGSASVRTAVAGNVYYDNYSIPVYSGTATIAPTYPEAVPHATRDMYAAVVIQKSTNAAGGTITWGSGWTGQGSKLGAGGYEAQAVDTGNVDISIATKDSVDGSETGAIPAATLGSYNTAGGAVVRLTRGGDGAWDFASTTGSDVTGGAALSVVYDTQIALAPGDAIIVGWAQPTDVTTPKQFSAPQLTADGITFSEVVELLEFDSVTGNDLGGAVWVCRVLAGTGTVTVTFSATAAGTTTNVRGGSVLLRLREEAAGGTTYTLTVDSSSVALTATAVGLVASRAVSVDAASVALTPTDISFLRSLVLPVATASVALTPTDISMRRGLALAVESASVAATPTNIGLAVSRVVAIEAAAVALTATDITLSKTGAISLIVDSASIAVTPTDVALARSLALPVGAASVALTPADVGFARSLVVGVDAASVAVSATDIALAASRVVSVDSATIAVTPTDITLTQTGSYVLAVDPASVAVAATDVAFARSLGVAVDAASVTLTPTDVTFARSLALGVTAAQLEIATQDVMLAASRVLAVDSSAVAITPQEVTLTVSESGVYSLAVDSAAVALSASAVSLTASRLLAVDSAGVTATPTDVMLTRSLALGIEAASVAVSAQPVGLVGSFALPVGAASVAVSASDVGLWHIYDLSVEPAALDVGVSPIELLASRVLAVAGAAVSLTASPITLTFTPFVAFVPAKRTRYATARNWQHKVVS